MEHQTRISKYVMLTLLVLCYFDFEQVLASPTHSQSETVCTTDDGAYKGTYNKETQECCNGQIENKRPGLICCNGEFNLKKSKWECCSTRTGQELFNPADSVCCNGNVYDKESGQCEHNYCNNEDVWVDRLTHTWCCEDAYCVCGTLVEGVGACCGSDKIYNPKTEQCCRDDGNFSTVTSFDEQTVELGHQAHYSCCGTGSTMRSYNTLDEVCCNGIVHHRTPFHKCCANQYVDERTHLCCENLYDSTVASSFLIQDGRTECCMSSGKMTPYNPRTESCYGGKVTLDFGYGEKCLTEGVLRVYNPTTSSCCKQETNEYVRVLSTDIPSVPHITSEYCCDGEAYLKSEKICCSDTLYDRTAASQMCCGIGDPINTDTHFCLDDTPTLKPSPYHNICGSELYNTHFQTCCGGRLFNVSNAQCCEESGAYDPATQTCCRGRGVWPNNDERSAIHDGGDQAGKCCGEQLLQDNQLCVEESGFTVIVDISENPDHNMWCYGGDENVPDVHRIYTYDLSKKACSSNGYVTSLFEGEKVCGGRTYDTTHQICCGGLVRAKVKHGAEHRCCGIGTQSYNPAIQQCDGGVVSQRGAQMCGGTEYDPQTEVCARGTCVRNRMLAERYTDFCGDDFNRCFDETRWYNPAETSCCAGKLLKPEQICCRDPQGWDTVQNIPNAELGDGFCCGGKAYNDHTHLCCGGTAHNITNNKGLECCGQQTIHPDDFSLICCDDNLWPTNGADMGCTDGVAHTPVTDEQTLCGNLVMDVTSHICCDGNIYLKSEGSQCCGNLPYNPEDPSQLCCMDSRHLNAEGKQCCRNTAIDPNTTACRVQGGVENAYPKADVARYYCSQGSYDDTQHTCCEGVLHHGIADRQCCGTEIVRNLNTEICCGGRLQTKEHSNTICCGGVLQNGDQYTCCGDEIVNQFNSYENCCNGVKYYTYASICENGSLRPLHTTPASPTTLPTTNPSPTTVIITSEVSQTVTEVGSLRPLHTTPASTLPTTNPTPTTEIITSEVIQTVTEVVTSELVPTTGLIPPLSVTAPSCGGTLYNQTASICCENQILPRFEGFRNCCSDAIYDTRTRICSKNGKIRRIRNGMTCGINYGEGELTHCNKFVCCNNTFHRIRNERNQCCGNATFNPAKQECCGGVVINSKQSRCCDGSPYEVGKEVCCGGVLFDLKTERVPAHCCPPGRYMHVKSGRCFRKDCMTCNQKHHSKFWKKKVCEKRYLLSASITSYERKESRFIFKASRITQLDSNTAQWQDEMKDISVVIDRGCKCQWVTRLLDGMKEEGRPKKEFLIMTDQEVIKGKKWVLSDDDLIMEANGKAFKVKMRCKRDMPYG